MSDISICSRIKDLYNQYQSQNVATEKQIKLIKLLGGEVNGDLSQSDAAKQIRYLSGSQLITPKQQLLLTKFPKDKVDLILKRDVDIKSVTRFELTRVLNVLQHKYLLKPSVRNHPIVVKPNYEYGWQESPKCPNNKLYYLTFYDFLMIDIDDPVKNGILNFDLLEIKLILNYLTARIYKTYNGYHIFITSETVYYKSEKAKELMDLLDCDLYYSTFSQLNGFKIRLNPKIREKNDELIAAEYLTKLGNQPENPYLLDLLLLHDKYIFLNKI